MADGFDENEEVFRNVSELKRRLHKTEVSLQRLQAPRHASMTESDSQDMLSLLSMRDLGCHDDSGEERRSTGERNPQRSSQARYRESRSWSKLSKPSLSAEHSEGGLLEKLHQLRKENSLLVKENNRLKIEVDSGNKALKSSQTQMIQHLDDSDILKEEVLNLRGDLKEKDKNLRSVQRELERSLLEQGQWEDVVNESRVEAENVREELKAETEARLRLEEEKDEFQALLESKAEGIRSFKGQVEQQLKQHEDTRNHLQTSLHHCDKEREELLNKATSLEGELQNAREEVRKLKKKLASSIGVQTISKELEGVMQDQEKQVRDLRERLDEATGENRGLREENERQRREMGRQDETIRRAGREREEQKRERAPSAASDSSLSTISHSVPPQERHFFLTPESARLEGVGAEQGTGTGTSDEPDSKKSPRTAAAELRLKQAMRNAEAQREQARWQQRSAGLSPEQSVMDGLRAELFAIVEQSKTDSRKSAKLQEIVRKLDEERKGQTKKLCRLQNQLDEVTEEKGALTRQCEMRDSHYTQIQKDMEEKANKLANLAQELQRKEMQVVSLESQLEKTTSDFREQLSSLSEVDSRLRDKGQECDQLERQLAKSSALLDEELKKSARMKSLHDEQCSELQQHMSQLQEEVNSLKAHLEDSGEQMQHSQQQVTEKTVRIGQLEAELHQTQIILQQKDAEFSLSRQTMERQMKEGWSKATQLETALVICREELSNYMSRLELTTEKYQLETATKSHEVLKLEKQLQHTVDQMGEKANQMTSLERALDERQRMLLESNRRIADLEEREGQMEQQVSQYEREVTNLKTKAMKKSEDIETKLNETKQQLANRTQQVQELSKNHSKLSSELQETQKKVISLEREALARRDLDSSHREEVSRLQKSLENTTKDLMEKVDKISELEEIIHNKDAKILEHQAHGRELDAELTRARGDIQGAAQQLTELQHLLQVSRAEVKERKEQMAESEEDLRQARADLKSKESDMLEMEAVLRSSHNELEERTKQVNQFDHIVKEHRQMVESRAEELEDQLDRSKQKMERQFEQISTLEQRCFEQEQELQRQSFHKQNVESDLVTKSDEAECKHRQILSLEQEVQKLQAQLRDEETSHGSKREDMTRIQQQYQQATAEQAKLRKQLTEAQDGMGDLSKQLEEVARICQSKDAECTKLAKQLGEAKAREVTVQSQLTSEMTKVTQQQHYELEQKEQELADLQKEHFQVLTVKDQQEAELNCLRNANERSQEQLKGHKEREARLNTQLKAKHELLQAANEAAVIKEAECARLSAQISGYERALLSRSNNGPGLSPVSKVSSALFTPLEFSSVGSTPTKAGLYGGTSDAPYSLDPPQSSIGSPVAQRAYLTAQHPSYSSAGLSPQKPDRLPDSRDASYAMADSDSPPTQLFPNSRQPLISTGGSGQTIPSTSTNQSIPQLMSATTGMIGRFSGLKVTGGDSKKPLHIQGLPDKFGSSYPGAINERTEQQFTSKPPRDSVEGLNMSSFQDMLAYVNRKMQEDTGRSSDVRGFPVKLQDGSVRGNMQIPSNRFQQVGMDSSVGAIGRTADHFAHDDNRGSVANSRDSTQSGGMSDDVRGFPSERRGFLEGQLNSDTSRSVPSSTEKKVKHVTYSSDVRYGSSEIREHSLQRVDDAREFPQTTRGIPKPSSSQRRGTGSGQLSGLGNTMPFISSLLANKAESPSSGSDKMSRFPKGADSPESQASRSDYEDTLVKRFSSSLDDRELTATNTEQRRTSNPSTLREPGKKAVNRSLFDGREKPSKTSATRKTQSKIPKR